MKKRIGKRGGLASTLIDIYSIFFYIFVLLLFIIIFSLHRGCSSSTTLGLGSDKDTTIETRMLLLNLLRTPVTLSDGRTMDIAELIVLNEMPSEDLEAELKDVITGALSDYILYVFEGDIDQSYIDNLWEMKITYREGSSVKIGKVSSDVCTSRLPITYELPLAYSPAEDSQTAEIKFSPCTDFLGVQWGGYSLPLSAHYPSYQGLVGMQWGDS